MGNLVSLLDLICTMQDSPAHREISLVKNLPPHLTESDWMLMCHAAFSVSVWTNKICAGNWELCHIYYFISDLL